MVQRKAVILLTLALLLSVCLATGFLDEAYGRVVKVVDGNTFDVALQDYNSSHLAEVGKEASTDWTVLGTLPGYIKTR
ncbi:MAG: hypothetical protein A4E49_02325 [Methanosaeta sp. PtaU1.Bin112]|jgi:hypothetical protein|nr:MAG: hypothetical protein A4E49_02325 [Methanosaeta sp. PtaU1.Bin112]